MARCDVRDLRHPASIKEPGMLSREQIRTSPSSHTSTTERRRWWTSSSASRTFRANEQVQERAMDSAISSGRRDHHPGENTAVNYRGVKINISIPRSRRLRRRGGASLRLVWRLLLVDAAEGPFRRRASCSARRSRSGSSSGGGEQGRSPGCQVPEVLDAITRCSSTWGQRAQIEFPVIYAVARAARLAAALRLR